MRPAPRTGAGASVARPGGRAAERFSGREAVAALLFDRPRSMRFLTKFVLALLLPALVPPEPYPPLATLSYTGAGPAAWTDCPSPEAIGGDTIGCGAERVRLPGTDAQELDPCPRHRHCAAADPVASRPSLGQAVSSGPVRYRTVRSDRYGRSVAAVSAGAFNLPCRQIGQGCADHLRRWDDGGSSPARADRSRGSNPPPAKFVPLNGSRARPSSTR